MTTFEIIILGAIYIFAMLVEIGFQVEDSATEKNMSSEDKWFSILAVMLSPFSLAFQLGQLLQQKFFDWKEELNENKVIRTPITLEDFLFTLNQDEDIRVHLIDYERDERICTCWKSNLQFSSNEYGLTYRKYKDWFVQDFICTTNGLEITIVELEAELD